MKNSSQRGVSEYRGSLISGGGDLQPETAPVAGTAPMGWAAESVSTNGPNYWPIVRQHKLLLVLSSSLGLVAGIIWSSYQPRVYQAKATFEVQRVNEDFLNMRSVVPTTPEIDLMRPDYDVRTQSELIQSRTVLERSLDEPGLQQRLLSEIPSPAANPWQRLLSEIPSPAANLWLRVFPSQNVTRTQPRDRALAEVVRRLKVRTRSSAGIVEVTFDAMSPNLAADFANSILDKFIQVNLEERWRTSRRTTEWLTRQLHDLKGKIESSETELQKYARSWNLIFTEEKDNVAVQRLKQLQDELLKARADLAIRQARYELAKTAPADSLPAVLDDQTLKDYGIALTAVRKDVAELRSVMTPQHPKVAKAMAQQSELTAAFEKVRGNIVARIRNEYEEARRRENLLADDYTEQVRQISGQADKIARYNLLRREIDSSRQLYDSLFQRVNEAGLAAAVPTSNIRIVDSATQPLVPYRPNGVINSAIGMFCGLTLGIAIAFFQQRSEKGFQNPGEVAGYLRLCELGVIPSLPSRATGGMLPISIASRRWLAASGAHQEPTSLASPELNNEEAYRIALPGLMFSGQNATSNRAIIVSSAEPGEGKTTICTNLAIALSKAGRCVLLIDADTRRPRIHQFFGIDNREGFSDLLRGSVQNLCRETNIPQLQVLPAGESGDPDLIFSPRLPQILESFRDRFDAILIDTPPVLHAPDARILAHHAGAAILVVRAHKTDREAARLASELLEADGVSVLGTILNDWKAKHYRGYGYHGYYGAYGSNGTSRADS